MRGSGPLCAGISKLIVELFQLGGFFVKIFRSTDNTIIAPNGIDPGLIDEMARIRFDAIRQNKPNRFLDSTLCLFLFPCRFYRCLQPPFSKQPRILPFLGNFLVWRAFLYVRTVAVIVESIFFWAEFPYWY